MPGTFSMKHNLVNYLCLGKNHLVILHTLGLEVQYQDLLWIIFSNIVRSEKGFTPLMRWESPISEPFTFFFQLPSYTAPSISVPTSHGCGAVK
jgi:hypothetical protein